MISFIASQLDNDNSRSITTPCGETHQCPEDQTCIICHSHETHTNPTNSDHNQSTCALCSATRWQSHAQPEHHLCQVCFTNPVGLGHPCSEGTRQCETCSSYCDSCIASYYNRGPDMNAQATPCRHTPCHRADCLVCNCNLTHQIIPDIPALSRYPPMGSNNDPHWLHRLLLCHVIELMPLPTRFIRLFDQPPNIDASIPSFDAIVRAYRLDISSNIRTYVCSLRDTGLDPLLNDLNLQPAPSQNEGLPLQHLTLLSSIMEHETDISLQLVQILMLPPNQGGQSTVADSISAQVNLAQTRCTELSRNTYDSNLESITSHDPNSSPRTCPLCDMDPSSPLPSLVTMPTQIQSTFQIRTVPYVHNHIPCAMTHQINTKQRHACPGILQNIPVPWLTITRTNCKPQFLN